MRFRSSAARALCLLLCAALLFCAAACAPRPERFETVWYDVFDTVTTLSGYAESRAEFDAAAARVHDALARYHTLFDIYHDAPEGANLKTVNDRAGEWVSVDPELIRLLLLCRQLDEVTGHKTDASLGAVLKLWHDARETAASDPDRAAPPDPEALREASRHTGFALVEIDEAGGRVRLTDPSASLDIGAVGKGCAAELAKRLLPDGYLLSLGGNIVPKGAKPDGSAWTIGVRSPDDAGALLHTVRVTDRAVVTSGDYQRSFTVNGVRYHHIIDPDTLYPAARWRSVTVLCADSGLADGLSTALFLTDLESGTALLERYGADALWVGADGTEHMTAGFSAALAD